MAFKTKLAVLCLLSSLYFSVNAQIEVAGIKTTHYSSFGFGGFLNFAIPVNDDNSITGEAGFYYFNHNQDEAVLVPFLVGYRHFLEASAGYGWYVEPYAGYSIGSTDQPKTDADGAIIYRNGSEVDEGLYGINGGAAFGYIFDGNARINLALRFLHVFSFKGDPSANMLSLRISHSLHFGRRGN